MATPTPGGRRESAQTNSNVHPVEARIGQLTQEIRTLQSSMADEIAQKESAARAAEAAAATAATKASEAAAAESAARAAAEKAKEASDSAARAHSNSVEKSKTATKEANDVVELQSRINQKIQELLSIGGRAPAPAVVKEPVVSPIQNVGPRQPVAPKVVAKQPVKQPARGWFN